MIYEILPVGALQCNCSILGDEASREAIVVDPGDQIDQILKILAQHKLRVKAIVITHAHIDHIGGAQKLKAEKRCQQPQQPGHRPEAEEDYAGLAPEE